MDVADRPLLRRALRATPGLEEELALLPRLVRTGDVCLDVGASYGTYTAVLARLVGPRGRVHAFEPRPRSRRVLHAVAAVAGPGRVAVHDLALSDHPGTHVLVTPRRRWLLPVPGRTFLQGDTGADQRYYEGFESEFGGATEREVVTTTIDGFVRGHAIRRVAFVKIDVEGAELKVLGGGGATIAEHRPVVLCEIEDRHTSKYGTSGDDVLRWLVDRAYRCHIVVDGALVDVDHVHPDHRNHVFVPSEVTSI